MAKEINNVISHNEVTHPKLSSYNERLQAYINLGCPIDLQQKPEKMAEAGFYYLGRSDKVGCFYCGGFLQHWQPSDDPWEEHAKAFSRCTFINLIKSPEYVRNITKDTKQITTLSFSSGFSSCKLPLSLVDKGDDLDHTATESKVNKLYNSSLHEDSSSVKHNTIEHTPKMIFKKIFQIKDKKKI